MNTPNITNYKPKDFAELLGVSVKTLQRWDREGILKANRTPTDRRYYTYEDRTIYRRKREVWIQYPVQVLLAVIVLHYSLPLWLY